MRKFLFIFCIVLSCFKIGAQPVSFTSKGIGGGGALFSPSINPANNQEMYLSCDMSELFHSTNLGVTYEQVPFQQFTGGHNSKVNFTSTVGLLFALSYINDTGTPVKSTDNGLTWNTLPGNPDPDENNYTLKVDYTNPNRILLSNYNQLYFSSNGGTTFTSIHTAVSGGGIVVAGCFFDGNNIYIGTNDGVITSQNGGLNWSIPPISGLPANDRIWSFSAAKQGGVTRFFCLTGNLNDVYVGMQGSDYWDFFKGIYMFDVGSTDWVPRVSGIVSGTDFPLFIDMAENDITTVYIAGSNSSFEPNIMKSTDAGTSWSRTFKTAGNQNIKTGWSGQGGDRGWSYGECPFGFEVASNNSSIAVFTDFGFCHKTVDGGTSWEQAYVNKTDENPADAAIQAKKSYQSIGLENTTSWQVHWTSATNMWACFSDIRGLRRADGGNSWSFNYAGNAANSSYRIAQGTDGKLFAATSNIHDMYQSTRLADNPLDNNDPNGKIIYSTDNGLNWQNLHIFNHPVFWIAIDPNNANRAYASVIHYNGGAGVGGVYRCDNLSSLAASTWTLLPTPLRTEKHPASLTVLNDGKLVASFSGRRTTSAFTASSGVFIYNPAANSWTDVSAPGMIYWTKDVVIDPNDVSQNTWYAGVFSGWGGAPNGLGGLYKTTNRGTSWTKLTDNLLDRVTSCTFNPDNVNEIYVTTETQGLWVSKNINSAVPDFSLVSAYPFRQPERVFFNPFNSKEMWVSSFGNGMKMGLMNGIPLPVTLLDFKAGEQENMISLKWEVASEKDFGHYELQKSLNPKSGFGFLAKILPSASSTGSYLYNDSTATQEIEYYYRLKMIDTDGSIAYSKIVNARISSDYRLTVFPNPAHKEIQLSGIIEIQSVSIINAAGQVVGLQKFKSGKQQSVKLANLPNGFYIFKITDVKGNVVNRKVAIE